MLQVHITKCLGIYGIEIQIPSTISRKKTSWVVICRGQRRYEEELPHLEPGPNPTRKELLRENRCRGNRIFCREEPIPHRGNSCAAGICSCESRVLCERDDSYGGRRSTQVTSVTRWVFLLRLSAGGRGGCYGQACFFFLAKSGLSTHGPDPTVASPCGLYVLGTWAGGICALPVVTRAGLLYLKS